MEDIIKSIPQLLLFFIPGFISLRMKEIYGFQKRHSKFITIIFSFLYSFFVLVIYMITLNIIRSLFPSFGNNLSPDWKSILIIIYFVLWGVILGWIIARIPRSKLGRWFAKLINPLYSPEQTVREVALVHSYGAEAYVHLKNGMIYHGTIGPNPSDPEDPEKALIIYDFTTAIRNETNLTGPDNCYIWIKPKYKKYDDRELVYIKFEEIMSIEVTPISEKENEETKEGQSQKK